MPLRLRRSLRRCAAPLPLLQARRPGVLRRLRHARADLRHGRDQPQPGARLRRHGELRPRRVLRRRRLRRSRILLAEGVAAACGSPGRRRSRSAALAALVIGAISLRTRGVYFIMITLAFAQMMYYLFVSLKSYGGDDGLTLPAALDSASASISRDDLDLLLRGAGLAARRRCTCCTACSTRASAACSQAIRENETRAEAIGFPVYRYKLLVLRHRRRGRRPRRRADRQPDGLRQPDAAALDPVRAR